MLGREGLGLGGSTRKSETGQSESGTLSAVCTPACNLAFKCPRDSLGREIIKTSLAPGREIEKQEKGEGEHQGKRYREEKTKEETFNNPALS